MKKIYVDALKALEDHQVIAFPTETVFGLGVFFDDKEAYNLLNRVKNRREDKPYTMMLSSPLDIEKYAEVNPKYLPIIKKYMPGSLTVLLKAKENVPSYVTHDTGIIGIRIPHHNEALQLLRFVNKPLLVPSANKADQKPALSIEEVKNIFKDEIKVIVPGRVSSGLPSTIVDLTGPQIKLIRQGQITLEELESLIA